MAKTKKRPLSPEEKLLRGYQRKLTVEAIIKSLVLALIAGFMLCILVSIISFATKFNALWISLGVWAAATAGLSVLFYFKIFRTTLDKTASRVDGMGLDERVITMIEFAGSDNVIAKAQRRDTAEILQSVTPKHMKFAKTKIFIVLASCLAAIAVAAVPMMVVSTVQAVAYEKEQAEAAAKGEEEPELSEEDKIIKQMLEDLRQEIADAKIQKPLRDKLNGMVDDLEKSLKSTDSKEVKIAKISETAQKIHKILQNDIPYQLQQHDTTTELGKALDTGDIKKIEAAFEKMYDSIHVLASEQKYDQLKQTAEDILQSIDDAEAVDEDLKDALEKLAKAFLAAIPPPPEQGGEEPKSDDEVDQAVQDAIQEALGSIKDNKDDIDQLDKDIQGTISDALESLGQETPDPEEEEKKDEETGDTDVSPSNPNIDGELVYDSVIDGKTEYDKVYGKYEREALEQLLASGNLTDEERQIIENYIGLLKPTEGDNNG
ncbi:MAG: hypothetical protein K2O28_05935 [Clostridia bacterium]|nr:hypothetical protein [Clostridia bacterium]